MGQSHHHEISPESISSHTHTQTNKQQTTTNNKRQWGSIDRCLQYDGNMRLLRPSRALLPLLERPHSGGLAGMANRKGATIATLCRIDRGWLDLLGRSLARFAYPLQIKATMILEAMQLYLATGDSLTVDVPSTTSLCTLKSAWNWCRGAILGGITLQSTSSAAFLFIANPIHKLYSNWALKYHCKWHLRAQLLAILEGIPWRKGGIPSGKVIFLQIVAKIRRNSCQEFLSRIMYRNSCIFLSFKIGGK